MKKENTLLILWIIFGFVFIKAVDSVLFLITHLVYFGTSEIGISYNVLKFIIPTVTFVSYILATTLLLKQLKANSKSTGIYLTDFPKRLFTILIIIAIFLNPITNKLAGLFAEFNAINQSGNATEYINFYGWMHFGIGFSRWIILVILAYTYFNKYNSELIKN